MKTLDSLQDGDVVRYRTGIAGANSVVWNEFKTGPLYIVRRTRRGPRRPNRESYKVNAIVTLRVHNENCPDYSIDDCVQSSRMSCIFNCEEYYLQIEFQ